MSYKNSVIQLQDAPHRGICCGHKQIEKAVENLLAKKDFLKQKVLHKNAFNFFKYKCI